jgi:predicted nuclease of restriction endonuclease-like (RecB) superfamily
MPLIRKNNFEGLVSNISHIHEVLQGYASKSVNQFLTLRNWIFGYYIVEYEQNGEDRAKYGENLISNITQKVNHIKGLTGNQLYVCRNFYLLYPHFLRTVSVILQSCNTEEDEILRTLSVKLQSIDYNGNAIPYSLFAKSSDDTPDDTILLKSEENNNELQLSPKLLLSRLSFSHFIELIRVEDSLQRLFYEVETIKNNWSIRELKRAIGTSLAFRTVMSTNKEAVIAKIKNLKPATNAEVIRNPYVLEFLGLDEKSEYSESILEQRIITHLQQFLMELGTGFCFEARQKRITFDNEHYRIDLVFYHKVLKCNILIDLKLREYRYADAGQMNLYLNYYKENEMSEGDNPPIGIILCSDKSDTLVKYSSSGMDDQLFVSKYLVKLPEKKVLENFIKRELEQ